MNKLYFTRVMERDRQTNRQTETERDYISVIAGVGFLNVDVKLLERVLLGEGSTKNRRM